MTSPLASEVRVLYQPEARLHRESLAITARAPDNGWDWGGLRVRCVREAGRVLPRVDAEEAAQEALARAWLRRDACRHPDAPLPWLLEITRNEARRLLGRKARRERLELFDVRSGEDDELTGMADRVTVEQALRTLADGDRRMLHLRYAEDLTQVEVARRLGVPEGTVKVRLHRARRRLRRVLEDQT
jgi:RNA polymerase sigma-70 factor, ECF subfamily